MFDYPLQAVAAPALLPPVREETFGALINLTGQQRMLSHRVCLAISMYLVAADEAERARLRSMLVQALERFRANVAVIQQGDAATGISPLFAPSVRRLLAPEGQDGAHKLRHFIERAGWILERLETLDRRFLEERAFKDLAGFVTTELLALLSAMVKAYEDDLESLLRQRREDTRRTSGKIQDTLDELAQLAQLVRIIGVNTAVEASRVGLRGSGIAAIAREMQAISERVVAVVASTRGVLGRIGAGLRK